MAHKFVLLVTKTQYTLDGNALDRNERHNHLMSRVYNNANPNIVRHFTVLLQKACTTSKKAWDCATPELIDSLGLFHDGISYTTDYAEYDITVAREDRLSDYISY